MGDVFLVSLHRRVQGILVIGRRDLCEEKAREGHGGHSRQHLHLYSRKVGQRMVSRDHQTKREADLKPRPLRRCLPSEVQGADYILLFFILTMTEPVQGPAKRQAQVA